MVDPKMRAAQLGRWRRGLVDLAPIYRYNAEYARRSIEHAARHGLMAYRLSSDVFPLLDVDPGLRKLVPSLAPLRSSIERTGVHVSAHPGQFTVLSTPHAHMLDNSLRVLLDAGWIMNRVRASGSITIHGGGVYEDRLGAARRLMEGLRLVSRRAREHLALENDEHCWTVPELLDATGGHVPIVFDKLHWQANARSAAYATELAGALATWPPDRIPELHYSEQAPDKPHGAHGVHVTGKGLLAFLEEVAEHAKGRDVAVVIEAKRKDLAIARAIGELGGSAYRRLLALVPDLRRAPRDWPKDAAAVEAALDGGTTAARRAVTANRSVAPPRLP
jgi:UV DNA damage endonuclease